MLTKNPVRNHTKIDGVRKSCKNHIFLKSNHISMESVRPVIMHSKISNHYPSILQLPKNFYYQFITSLHITEQAFLSYKLCNDVIQDLKENFILFFLVQSNKMLILREISIFNLFCLNHICILSKSFHMISIL